MKCDFCGKVFDPMAKPFKKIFWDSIQCGDCFNREIFEEIDNGLDMVPCQVCGKMMKTYEVHCIEGQGQYCKGCFENELENL